MAGRRVSLPGAAELFRSTWTEGVAADTESTLDDEPAARSGRRSGPPSGRVRHDEKITVYVSADELIDLERARLALRGEYGLAVDRGRIVREAVAVMLADLEANGEASVLVRRLHATGSYRRRSRR